MSAVAELRPVLTKRAGPRSASSGTTPEFELLLACCAIPQNDRIEPLLAQECDWERFLRLVEHHRVVPHVYRRLAPYSQQVPDRDFEALHVSYEQNARKALWFTAELVRILEHLEAHGIAAMPYKGPALAQTLYSDVTARQFGDLDILVRPEDVRAAKDALSQLRYKPAIRLSEPFERAYVASGYEYSFDGPSGPHLLELQWRILPRFYTVDFDFADFFKRPAKVDLAGRSFRTLALEDLVLALCVHAAKHVWVQLTWLCDLAELARSQRIDWETTWQRAAELGIRRIVTMNFLLVQEFLGPALPLPIRRWLEKDRLSEILKNEIAQMVPQSCDYDTESVAYFRLMARLRERGWDKARFLWRLFWTPSVGEWSTIHLPSPLSPFYRAVRLWRLAARLTRRK